MKSCKFCSSRNIIKYGQVKGGQRWWCNDCHRKFADNGAIPRMKIHREHMALAVSMYFDGFAIKDIREKLDLNYHNRGASSSINDWIIRSSLKVAKEMERLSPRVGDTWLAGSTVCNIGTKDIYLWNVIDKDTRYLMAAGMSFQPGTQYAAEVVKLAVERVSKAPQTVLVEQYDEYQGCLDFGSGEVKPVRPFPTDQDHDLIEYLNGQLVHHSELLQGLRNIEKAKIVTEGWLCHHNCFKRCNDINGELPSKLTGVDKSLSFDLLAYFARVRRIIEATPQS